MAQIHAKRLKYISVQNSATTITVSKFLHKNVFYMCFAMKYDLETPLQCFSWKYYRWLWASLINIVVLQHWNVVIRSFHTETQTCLHLWISTYQTLPGSILRNQTVIQMYAITASQTMLWSMFFAQGRKIVIAPTLYVIFSEPETHLWWRTDQLWRMSGLTEFMRLSTSKKD